MIQQEEAKPTTPLTDALMAINPIMYFIFRYVVPYVGFALSFGIAILPTMIDLRLRFDAWWIQTPIYALRELLPPQEPADPLLMVLGVLVIVFALTVYLFSAIQKSIRKAY